MALRALEAMEFRDWQGVVGSAIDWEERFSKEPINAWIWKGKPVETSGYLVQRRNKKNGEVYTMFSVPASDMGYSNPFRDYLVRGDIPQVYKLSQESLYEEVLGQLRKQRNEAEEEFMRIGREYDAAEKAYMELVGEEV